MTFTEPQLKALTTATLYGQHRLGFTIKAGRTSQVAVCNQLCESGHLIRVDAGPKEHGYRIRTGLLAR